MAPSIPWPGIFVDYRILGRGCYFGVGSPLGQELWWRAVALGLSTRYWMGQSLNDGSIEQSVFKMYGLTGAVQSQKNFVCPSVGWGEWLEGKQLNLVLLVAEHFSSLPASEQDQELKKLSCSEPGAGIWEGKIGMDNIWAYIVWLVTSLIFQLRRFK